MFDFRRLVDRVLQVNTKIIGEDVTYYPKDGGVYKVRGIFDNSYQSIDPETEEIISANQAMIGVNLNDFPGNIIYKGDEFKIRNIVYKVIDSQEDGQGGSVVMLQRTKYDEKIDLRKYPRSYKG